MLEIEGPTNLRTCPEIGSRFRFPSPYPLSLFLLRRAGEGTDGGTYLGTSRNSTKLE